MRFRVASTHEVSSLPAAMSISARPLLAKMRDVVRETVDFSKPSPLW